MAATLGEYFPEIGEEDIRNLERFGVGLQFLPLLWLLVKCGWVESYEQLLKEAQ